MRPLKILTWHVHGHYLYYLSRIPHQIYLPVKDGGPPGYAGRTDSFPWPENVREVPAEEVSKLDLDCVLYQSRKNYLVDQFEVLGDDQWRLPRVFLEHDPPREHPTDTRHVVDDDEVLLVHPTSFNQLMWDSGRTPTRVIEHGVVLPEGAAYRGDLARGIVVVNNLAARGRRLGADIFEAARARVPLDLVGMGFEELEGLGEIAPMDLPAFEGRYRFFFNPIRYTSLGLAVCEAMMLGMPVVALATTEMVTVVENGVTGYLDTDLQSLLERMRELLRYPGTARHLGAAARAYALERFGIERFVRDWNDALSLVTGAPAAREEAVAAAALPPG